VRSILEVDGGSTIVNLGYAVVGLAVGEVIISRRVHSDDGSTTQSRSCRSLRAVGATVGVALTVIPLTLHPFVVDMLKLFADEDVRRFISQGTRSMAFRFPYGTI
jgi:hypothetical protein